MLLVICPKENLKASAKNSYFITRMFCVIYLLLYAIVVIFFKVLSLVFKAHYTSAHLKFPTFGISGFMLSWVLF